jgi:hypothetical protein
MIERIQMRTVRGTAGRALAYHERYEPPSRESL